MKAITINDVRTGDVGMYRNEFWLASPVTWLAAAIRWATRSKYNHAVVFVNVFGRLMIYEALGNGIRCRPANKFLIRKRSEILILRKKENLSTLDEFDFAVKANNLLGTEYGFKDILYQAWYRLTGKWLGPENDTALKALTCTEFVAYMHHLPSYYKASPKELLQSTDFRHYKLIQPPQDK